MVVGINVVDLYYDIHNGSSHKIISHLYRNILYSNNVCILYEKGVNKYINAIRQIGINVSNFCNCNYNNIKKNCNDCICYNKHESHLGLCCVGKGGIDAIIMVKCKCDEFREGIKHECLNNLGCEDIGGCWVLCTGLKH